MQRVLWPIRNDVALTLQTLPHRHLAIQLRCVRTWPSGLVYRVDPARPVAMEAAHDEWEKPKRPE
jgi:hypothetical protein